MRIHLFDFHKTKPIVIDNYEESMATADAIVAKVKENQKKDKTKIFGLILRLFMYTNNFAFFIKVFIYK